MARLKKFPFVPDMDDCKMTVTANGAVCYIMDTCCRNMTAADKAAADERILQIYVNHRMIYQVGRIAVLFKAAEHGTVLHIMSIDYGVPFGKIRFI